MSEPIRVLHVLQRLEAGGTQALLMNIYRNIDRTKVQFDFLVEYKEKQFYDDEVLKLGGRIYYCSVREDYNIIKFSKEIRRILLEHKNEYRIIHVHAYTIGYFVLREAHKCGVPVRIAHSHSNETVRDWKYIPKLILQKLYTLYATDLFACSEEAGKYLYKNKPFKVLRNAIDSKKFIADEHVRRGYRNKLNLNGKYIVGTVGRLHPQKNQKFLIDVFSILIKEEPDAVLLIIGDGPLKHELELQVERLELTSSVYFLGVQENVNEIVQAFDVFVLPSLFEGLGIVAIEAQAAGIPIIASTGVPKDIEISPLIKRLDLSEGKEAWANEIIQISQNKLAHQNMQSHIIDHGYDISETSRMMQDYYLNCWMKE